MFPFIIFSYAAAAIGFYCHVYRTAPVMEEGGQECKVYELFPAVEEQRRAA